MFNELYNFSLLTYLLTYLYNYIIVRAQKQARLATALANNTTASDC